VVIAFSNFRHCKEGAFPDEAISCNRGGDRFVALQAPLAMTITILNKKAVAGAPQPEMTGERMT
jgi:hypothetical protein